MINKHLCTEHAAKYAATELRIGADFFVKDKKTYRIVTWTTDIDTFAWKPENRPPIEPKRECWRGMDDNDHQLWVYVDDPTVAVMFKAPRLIEKVLDAMVNTDSDEDFACWDDCPECE